MNSLCIFAFPTPIHFGPASIGELRGRAEKLGAKKPLVVTDAGLLATAAYAKAMSAAGPEWPVFSDVQSNPSQRDVEAATEAYRRNACDAVIGLGGGSALDVAKIIRL